MLGYRALPEAGMGFFTRISPLVAMKRVNSD